MGELLDLVPVRGVPAGSAVQQAIGHVAAAADPMHAQDVGGLSRAEPEDGASLVGMTLGQLHGERPDSNLACGD